MGWIFAVILFVAGCVVKDTMLVVASGLFAIAGAVGSVAIAVDGKRGDRGSGDGGSGVAK